MRETYFLTGALGCIGAWVVKALVERGDAPLVFDLGGDPRRIRDLLDEAGFARVRFASGDVTDYEAVKDALQRSGAAKVVHLAGLQVPFCRADPALGAKVNVVGTVNVLQAAVELGLERVVYASSAAVYGPPEEEQAPDEAAPCEPTTHYGVYKRANEGSARIYWQDNGLSSVGLRPLTVYGAGRDQGLTSGPTSAIKAAILGRPFRIAFSGATDFHYAADTAAAFLACADRAPSGARLYNLHGETVAVERFIEVLDQLLPAARRGLVSCGGPPIPIPPRLDGAAIREAIPGLPATPLEHGIAETIALFEKLRAQGRLDTRDLP